MRGDLTPLYLCTREVRLATNRLNQMIKPFHYHEGKFVMSKPTGDARVVTTDALETLGTIHTTGQHRDAIHLAVEPVIAGEVLSPGQHIIVREGMAFSTNVGQGLGIVDPFLKVAVMPGQPFWFVMYPRQVHSLRHVWTHPAFPDAA
jgi:hypothetical protein